MRKGYKTNKDIQETDAQCSSFGNRKKKSKQNLFLMVFSFRTFCRNPISIPSGDQIMVEIIHILHQLNMCQDKSEGIKGRDTERVKWRRLTLLQNKSQLVDTSSPRWHLQKNQRLSGAKEKFL